jgi:hypothetical protein
MCCDNFAIMLLALSEVLNVSPRGLARAEQRNGLHAKTEMVKPEGCQNCSIFASETCTDVPEMPPHLV